MKRIFFIASLGAAMAACGDDDPVKTLPEPEPVAVTEVRVSPATLELEIGDAEQLTATVLPATANNKTVTWSVGPGDVASISTDGLVTALKAGEAKITVTTVDGNKTATATVTINAEPQQPALPGPPSGVPMRTVGYIPDYAYHSITNNTLDWSALTHINLAFVNPDNGGNMVDYFPDNDLKTIVDRAHTHEVKVLPSIGGGGGGQTVAELISTADGRERLCGKIMDYILENDMDGVDLDLEFGQGSSIWSNYGEFVAMLRRECDGKGLLLTTAVSTWFSNDISTETLRSFDFVNIMAYDNDTNGFEYHSSYGFAETMAAHYAGRGVEPGRIVIGVPFYGYPRNGGWGDAKSYSDILRIYPDAWKSDFAGGYSYNGHRTLKWKCRLATVYGGIMIWQLGQDAGGNDSLLKVIKDNL